MLISADSLKTALGQAQPPLVLDCRFDLADPDAGERAFKAGHIPGAAYLHLNRDLSSPIREHGGRHPLPDFDRLQNRLQSLGASAKRAIVLYDAQRGAFACRAWWLLQFCGVTAQVLDGGWPAWLAAEGPVEAGHTAEQRGTGDLQLCPGACTTRDFANLQDRQALTLVDSREPARYRGETEPIDPVAGHIPGALNLPWTTATDAEGKFLPAHLQRERWAGLAINLPEQLPVVYCGSGVTACVNLFSLQLAGGDGVLYPGSWSDWCSHLTPANRASQVAVGDR